ncbi:MAG: prepilin-type N-terminal cleavage/methylation domain-containing protein [Geobacteraceae bacterium]|nr:prepilin-type N-terminal cleavage/methylation domain-containing protein [Geobacteraceae bacterium]
MGSVKAENRVDNLVAGIRNDFTVPCSRPSVFSSPRISGFTLIELLVVIVILSITAALVIPRLPASDSMELKSSARTLASMLRYLGERSVASKDVYRLHINLSDNSIRVTRKLPSGDEVPPEDPMLARSPLGAAVVISDFESPRLGKVTEGDVMIDFGAAGLSEFMTVHIASPKGDSFTVVGYPGGKVKIHPGREEVAL